MSGEPAAPEPPPAPVPSEEKAKRSAVIFLLPLAFLVVLVGFAFSQLTSSTPAPVGFASPVRPVPAITAPIMDGDTIDFGGLKGPVLVNFFASWCIPCRAEHPVLMAMKDQGVPIIGVLHEDKVELGKALLAKDGDPFQRVALDPKGDVSLAFGISGVPESFLIDAKGMIVKSQRGPIVDQLTMQGFIDAYKAELAKAPRGG